MKDSKRWLRLRSPAATEARGTKPATGGTGNRGRRFTLSLGELSALTAIIGGLTYLMGLFVFALPIWRVYPVDFSEAWYATSLVPKTLVAGQGVTRMLGLPLAAGVYLVLVFALIDLIGSNYRSVGTLWRKGKSLKVSLILLLAMPVLICVVLWFFYKVALGTKLTFLQNAITGLAMLLASIFTLRTYLRRYGSDLKFESLAGNARQLLLPLLIILFLYQFANQAALVAQKTDPPLPRVEITWTTDASNSTKATLTEGGLLTHTESFWYVLNEGGQDAGLTAIPDDEVQHVRIGPPPKEHGG